MLTIPEIHGLRSGAIELYRLTLDNFESISAQIGDHPDAHYLRSELETYYLPESDEEGRVTTYGFYATLGGVLAGFSLLNVDDWHNAIGSTGADVLPHMRGKGVTPGSKPHLFYLGFAILGLNRIETGHFVSNSASQRSIQKTPGFVYEGTMRESGRNDDGIFEDELLYAILRRDWLTLYKDIPIEVW